MKTFAVQRVVRSVAYVEAANLDQAREFAQDLDEQAFETFENFEDDIYQVEAVE